MMAFVLWFFVAMHLFLLEGVMLRGGTWVGSTLWVPDMAVVLCLFCAVFARPTALPGLVFCAALGRSVFAEGSLCVHLLVLGVPIAVLLPARLLFSSRSFLWPCLAAAALTFLLPKMTGLMAHITDVAPQQDAGALRIFLGALLVPPFMWLLALLPPLSLFREPVP